MRLRTLRQKLRRFGLDDYRRLVLLFPAAFVYGGGVGGVVDAGDGVSGGPVYAFRG